MRRRNFLAGLAALAPAAATASTEFTNAKALSGARFQHGEGEYLLADVIAPPYYRLDDDKPPHFDASRMALQSLLGAPIDVEDVLPATRWGVRRVVARDQGAGESLQAQLVSAGAVRVAPESADHQHIAQLLELESAARAARRGLWALQSYRVFDAENANGAIGGFHLIEGVVMTAAQHGGRFFLNFGEDYRTDFTAGAASGLYRRWLKDGVDLAAFAGVRLRIRGFVEAINGPSIDLKHPLQIERID